MGLYRQQTLLDELMAGSFARAPTRKLAFMATLFLTPEYLRQRGSLVAAFSRTAYAVKHLDAVTDFTESVNRIDDVIDTMPGRDITKLGQVERGTRLCDFLKNSKLDPDDYLGKLEKLIALGLTDRGTAIAFSNLYAEKLYARGALEPIARNATLFKTREQMAAHNIAVTQLYAVFIYRCFNKCRDDYKDADSLTYDTALHPYPNIAKIALLGQVMDDLRDLFIDMKSEMDTGIAAPNFVMAQLSAHGHLGDKNGRLNPDLRRFVAWSGERAVIPHQEWPLSIQSCVEKSVIPIFEANARGVKSAPSRAILRSYLHNTIFEGMRTHHHSEMRTQPQTTVSADTDATNIILPKFN
jgi:hypothetical protein